VSGRFLTVVGVSLLFLVLARGALADGAYLRTDDRRKTFVWNNDPQPDDAATWSGSRDSEGYAEGQGTLIWLRTEKKFQTGSNIFGSRKVPISRYTGNMVHGKFEGAVVTVDHGRTYHATFADGQRKGRWSLGPAMANAEKVQSEEGAESERAGKRAVAAEKLEKKTAEPEAPAAGPAEEKKESAKTDAHLAKTETPTGAMSADQLEEPATPSKPVTKKAALAPGAVHAIDQPGRTAEKKSEKTKEPPRKEKATPKPDQPQTEQAEPKSEPPAEGPPKSTEIPPASASQPSTFNLPPSEAAPSQPPPLKGQTSDKPVDDSIRALMGPPSSLHTRAPAASSPAAQESMPSAPASSPSSATPKLNAVQAMDIADIEARTRGYDLGEYQLPKAEYNAANDTWSVSYVGRDGEKSGKRLSVVVQDKNGKAEVKR
jgi:hypothetical protein